MTNKIKPRIILNRCLTDYYTYFFLLPIIYISGCEGDQGPAGSAGGVTELIVNVQNKMYTTGNAALIYDSGHYLKGKEIKLLYIP